ncbi:MAG: 1-acyl-sn-glycerol-3-phosphate acyltransferase [Ruminiclostridium sp.]|nr:1-acyl-sn-glycerol-3-phosphate acyltransferase [Ruminiclostridium sp.]
MKKFAVFVTKIVFNIFYRVEIINSENVPDKGPALLCATHNNMLDMFFLGYKLKRWIYWMAKEELFRNPISCFIFQKLGAFPIKRGKGDVGSIKATYKHFQEGNIVGIFPQGTRVKKNNRKKAAVKPGAALLATNAGVKVIPASVEGDYRLFGKIRVIFGEPYMIDVEKGKKLTSDELSEISRGIMQKIYSLTEKVN